MAITMQQTEAGKFQVTIGKVTTEYDTEAAAAEAVANAANAEAARLWAAAAIGGSKYKDAAFGLSVFRYAVNAKIAEFKYKPKEVTTEAVLRLVTDISDDDFDAAVAKAKELRAAYQQLNGKHQAPMKGGKTPRMVAENVAVLVKPATAAAQTEAAKEAILSAI